jgi:hypothetical protein
MKSRTTIEQVAQDDDDDRPTRRPPPVAELVKGVLPSLRRNLERHDEQRVSRDIEPIDDGAPADDDELPTVPPTRADAADVDGDDDDPTIVEPFAYFDKEDESDRPTERSLVAAAPVAADSPTSPPPVAKHRQQEPRRAPPPPPRAAAVREIVAAPVAYSPEAPPAVRVIDAAPAALSPRVPPLAGPGSSAAAAAKHQPGLAFPSPSAPSAPFPTAAAALPNEVFRSTLGRPERSKFISIAGGIAALLVIGGAGYLGTMSGKANSTTGTARPDESARVKVEAPPPVAAPSHEPEPSPPPPPSTEPSATAPAFAEPSPKTRDTVREPPPRRTTPDDETVRTRTSSETGRPPKTRTIRTTTDEEGAAPQTRLPDPSEAPAERPAIDQGALRAAFAEGEAKARACLGSTSPTGTARVSVTFAPTGEAVGAVVSGAPFANTLEGQCMVGKFRTLRVPAFTGADIIVRKSISFL